jgi:hypothetical protein
MGSLDKETMTTQISGHPVERAAAGDHGYPPNGKCYGATLRLLPSRA